MRLFILLLPWLELFTLIQLGIETSALTAIAYVLGTLVLGVLASAIVMWFSRWREYRADAAGAHLAGTAAMVGALQRLRQEQAAWQRQQDHIRQTEAFIRKNIEGQKTKQAQSRRKQLAKEEKLERPTAEPGLFRFRLEPVRESGGTARTLRSMAATSSGSASGR